MTTIKQNGGMGISLLGEVPSNKEHLRVINSNMYAGLRGTEQIYDNRATTEYVKVLQRIDPYLAKIGMQETKYALRAAEISDHAANTPRNILRGFTDKDLTEEYMAYVHSYERPVISITRGQKNFARIRGHQEARRISQVFNGVSPVHDDNIIDRTLACLTGTYQKSPSVHRVSFDAF